jgi:hypothetical protein
MNDVVHNKKTDWLQPLAFERAILTIQYKEKEKNKISQIILFSK